MIFDARSDGGWTKCVVANGMRIARVDLDPLQGYLSPRYYLSDALGSTRQLRVASRNLVFRAEYDPFGKPVNVQGSESYRFTGEKHDDPTGLVYQLARQYDPHLVGSRKCQYSSRWLLSVWSFASGRGVRVP